MDMQNAELGNGVFLGALDSMMDHIAIVDKQGIIEWTNNGWNAFSKNNGGQPSTTGQGSNYFSVCQKGARDGSPGAVEIFSGITDVAESRLPEFSAEYPCHGPAEKRWFIVRMRPIGGGDHQRFVISHQNITKRKEAEMALSDAKADLENHVSHLQEARTQLAKFNDVLEQRIADKTNALQAEVDEHQNTTLTLQSALEQKEILLDEVQHRVTNSLQVVSSLLQMQASSEENAEANRAIWDSYHRIMAMAAIHESLTFQDNVSTVEAAAVINTLINNIRQCSLPSDSSIAFDIQLDKVTLNFDDANRICQIINELVSNAIKHAFINREVGVIGIYLRRDSAGNLSLDITDDGVALPPGIDISTANSLGLRLVHALVSSIDGHVFVERTNGTKISMTFPARLVNER